jgi:hypothetical protein
LLFRRKKVAGCGKSLRQSVKKELLIVEIQKIAK